MDFGSSSRLSNIRTSPSLPQVTINLRRNHISAVQRALKAVYIRLFKRDKNTQYLLISPKTTTCFNFYVTLTENRRGPQTSSRDVVTLERLPSCNHTHQHTSTDYSVSGALGPRHLRPTFQCRRSTPRCVPPSGRSATSSHSAFPPTTRRA